jgi:DNA-binding NarL/FixJ family response regulator
VRYHSESDVIRAASEEGKPLITNKSSVIATGNRLTLACFCQAWFVKQNLVGGFTTEDEVKDACEKDKPDFLFIVDDLEAGYALNAIRAVKKTSPKTKCLLFTSRETLAVVRDAVNAHTDGVIFVSSIGLGLDGDFVPALKAVAAGGVYYPPAVRERAGYELQPLPDDLSERELEMLKALCAGQSNKEIAESLSLSTETVKTYVSSTIAKMGVNTRLEAAIKAIRCGL